MPDGGPLQVYNLPGGIPPMVVVDHAAFLSGACGMAYEVLYNRALSGIFGCSFAVSTGILITFLFGIGVAWVVRALLIRKYQPQNQPSAKSIVAEDRNAPSVSASGTPQQTNE